RTLAALVADRAIERVIDEQELEDAGARGLHLRRARRDHHAVGADGRTGRLQLRHLLDLDDADAAGAVDANARVIAVVGDRNSAFDRGLKDRLALLNGHLLAVDRQRHSVHKNSIIPSTCEHPERVPYGRRSALFRADARMLLRLADSVPSA